MVDDEKKEHAYSKNRKLKSMIYLKYYEKYKTDEERMQHIPKGLSAEDWQQMLRHFETPEFKLRATKFGSGKKLIMHAGSTPFTRLEYKMLLEETGEVPSASEVWMTRRSMFDPNNEQ